MQFHSTALPEHAEVPLADDGQWEEIVTAWSARQDRARPADGRNRCHVVAVRHAGELEGLVEAAGDLIVGRQTAHLHRVDPRTVFGRGTATAMAEQARAAGADLLVVDAILSPSQQRNLEELTGLPVQDREGLILAVFHRHARTRRARIQVELARLAWLRPRIRGLGLTMDQQAGGIGGGRGPGETASELLARQLDDRMVRLRRELATVARADAVQRKARDGCPRIGLVGYTNAGKTSLMNALTGTALSACDRPFETLDTTLRALTRTGGDVLIGDTVGFIRDLPPRLLESFATTLAVARDATLLAVVVDLSDPEWRTCLDTTHAVLDTLDTASIPRFYIFHKADRAPWVAPAALPSLAGGHPWATSSIHDPGSIDALRERLIDAARGDRRTLTLDVGWAEARVVAQAHATCEVLDEQPTDAGVRLTVRGAPAALAHLTRALGRTP